MISQDLLKEAVELIGGNRQTDYGDKLTNHQNIADLWSVFLKKKISAHDVAICMALVKVARLMNQHKKDSYIDGSAYFAIAGEIEARSKKKDQSFESKGERRGRISKEHIKSLNKCPHN
jgi:predicted transcriptional regulator YdeE